MLTIGFHMCDWQLLELEFFSKTFLIFTPEFEKQWKFSENEPVLFYFVL